METAGGRRPFCRRDGSTKLYETAGDAAALTAIGRLHRAHAKAAESTGGARSEDDRDEIMALFRAGPGGGRRIRDARHHRAAAEVGGTKLGVRVGFHSGPVIQREDDGVRRHGELAARLVEQAGRARSSISHERRSCSARRSGFHAAAVLDPGEGQGGRGLAVRGHVAAVEDRTTVAGYRPKARAAAAVLRLKYGDTELTRRRDNDLDHDRPRPGLRPGGGRPEGLAPALHHRSGARKMGAQGPQHNGTYVTAEGDSEMLLQREELTAAQARWIAFGSRARAPRLVEFSATER